MGPSRIGKYVWSSTIAAIVLIIAILISLPAHALVLPSYGELPPDPGVAGEATIAGIDVNANGVRDELELAIFAKYPNDPRIREFLYHMAIQYQAMLKQPTNATIVLDSFGYLAALSNCLESITGSASEEDNMMRSEVLNTYDRSMAYLSALDTIASASSAPVKTINCFALPSNGLDTGKPFVGIFAPEDGIVILPGVTTIAAVAYDNVGVAGVQFKLNGANLGIEDTTSPYRMSWNTSGLSSGTYMLSAVVRDVSGNTATSIPVSVILNACPTCNLPYGKAGTAYPVNTLRSGVWISRVALKTGNYPPGLSAYRADYDGNSYRSLKFGGTPTAAGVYVFGLEVWLSPIGGGSITYWYPAYTIEITP